LFTAGIEHAEVRIERRTAAAGDDFEGKRIPFFGLQRIAIDIPFTLDPAIDSQRHIHHLRRRSLIVVGGGWPSAIGRD
jgi:hypothetical protein